MSTAAVRRACVGLALTLCWTSTADAQQWAERMFNKLSHDFGVVARGADVRYRFKVTNLYKQDVHISSVRTTCGCSAARPSKNTLAASEAAYIEVTMNTLRFSRQKNSNLIVTFDAPQFAEVRIPVRAYIRTDVVLTPGAVNFGPVDQGQQGERKMEIAYAGRPDWTIRKVKSRSNYLSAKVVETGRSAGRVNYNLLVTLKPNAPVGTLREQIALITDDANSPQIPVLVEARVEADITVTPAVISLGTLIPGRRKPFNVVIRGKKPFAIAKLECESGLKAFKVRLPKSTRHVHVLPISVTPPNKPGKFTEEFTVTIAGRAEPVTFKAYGRILPANAN